MPNALAQETSPYLLQHADNPVQWWPWGEAALTKARAEQKPIFLSIGYSTCHWCHVMAHESFEDEVVAEILNAHFVPVKVDREERPDVDKVYMAYVQAMTGHGGWPLNAWLTPELKPFYGGTYFPPEDRRGRPGFASLLRAIAQGWATERDKLVAEGERVITALRDYYGRRGASHDEPGIAEGSARAPERKSLATAAGEAFEKGFEHFYENFDPTHGGFGGAPKFPRAANLNFLFRVAALQGRESELGAEAIKLATVTLAAMARGGIHDHVGGGYHRYSVDEAWFVPHFEKMLYDQAQIALNFIEAKQATGDERFAWAARDIFDYVQRELTSPQGGFYTAEDADSLLAHGRLEHAEGAYYVWADKELRAILGDDYALAAAHFGAAETGNVPTQLDPQGELRGQNILAQRRTLAETAKQQALTLEQANERVRGALGKLRAARGARPRPHLDDKVITANNGLMISAFARGHQVLGIARDAASAASDGGEVGAVTRPADDYLKSARAAAQFVERELFDPARGILFRAWRGARGRAEGFAEDYAYFVQGLLDLYEASFELHWLRWAERLQRTMDAEFWDNEGGGYFNSAAGDPNIVLRLKEDYDGAEPAPSSVAAMNLLRLGGLWNDETFRERGRACIEAFRSQWTQAPHALPQMLGALELALEPPRHVVLAGEAAQEDFRALTAVLHEGLGPRRLLLGLTDADTRAWLAQRAPWIAEMKPIGGRATAYVCEEFSCRAPTCEPAELRRFLQGG